MKVGSLKCMRCRTSQWESRGRSAPQELAVTLVKIEPVQIVRLVTTVRRPFVSQRTRNTEDRGPAIDMATLQHVI